MRNETKISVDNARTRGDGMEQETLITQDIPIKNAKITSTPLVVTHSKITSSRHSIPGENLIYKPNPIDSDRSLPAMIPKGKIFNLIPHIVYNHNTNIDLSHKASLTKREPKFIPFEPYKGAVNPIFPYKKSKNKNLKINRNNLDLNILVTQMSEMKTIELKNDELKMNKNKTLDSLFAGNDESEKMRKEIDDMKKERDYYSNELKFQSQVNSELKKLLVAAVGEDIQTKVNILTEDKLQLAKALLDTAQNLSSHTEQIEFLAGQSEVWRSKFLASSLMVEELARWKASLTQKNNLLFTSNKNLLELMSHLREMQIEILKNLKFLSNIKTLNLKSSNLLNLMSESLNISQHLVLHSGIGMPDDNLNLNRLDPLTAAEKLAMEGLQNLNQPLMPMDEAFRAIFGKAFSSIVNINKMEQIEQNNETELGASKK